MYRLNERHFFRLQTNVDRVMLFDYKKGKEKTFELTLKNNSTSKLLWRVKVTDNALFDINPPSGLLDMGEQTTVQMRFRGKLDPSVESPPELHHCAIYHMSYPFKKSKKQHRDADEAWDDAKEMWKKANKDKPNRLFYENQTARQYYLIDLVEASEPKDEDEEPYLSAKWTDDVDKLGEESEVSEGELWPDVAEEEQPVS